MKRRDLLKNTASLASVSAHPHPLVSTQSISGEFSPSSLLLRSQIPMRQLQFGLKYRF